jgi:hypothetical protein
MVQEPFMQTFQEWNSELNCLASRGEYSLRTATIGPGGYQIGATGTLETKF